MLDIKLIRENPSLVEADLKKRGADSKIELLRELIVADKERRDVIGKVENLKADRNKTTKKVADLKAKGEDISHEMIKVKDIPEQIKQLDDKLTKLDEQCKYMLMQLPNILHESVPVGKDDSQNVETKRWGLVPQFKFRAKNHLDLLQDLELIDSERAAKIAGHGFFYLKDKLAMLDYSIQRFAIDFLVKRGYTLIQPPFMMQKKPYEGATDLGAFADVLYKIDNEDLYMIATSEHPIAAMFMDETLEKKDLPMKFIGISPCFRKEVGAHGKYTKGLFRMHQFHKIEQFIFCLPENSWGLHE